MYSWSDQRRLMSLVLGLTLLLWVGVGSDASAFSGHTSGCHSGAMHLQHASGFSTISGSHHCCPQPEHPATLLQESLNPVSLECHQSCCKVRQQPVHAVAYVGSDKRQAAHSAGLSAKNVCDVPTTTFEVASAPTASFRKAVFDLKSDLRI
jgi:hypothetical protein